jgi:hypothetical protein
MNFPMTIADKVSDYDKEIRGGKGGPDFYPSETTRLCNPKTGVYRLYEELAGILLIIAAVQRESYSFDVSNP